MMTETMVSADFDIEIAPLHRPSNLEGLRQAPFQWASQAGFGYQRRWNFQTTQALLKTISGA